MLMPTAIYREGIGSVIYVEGADWLGFAYFVLAPDIIVSNVVVVHPLLDELGVITGVDKDLVAKFAELGDVGSGPFTLSVVSFADSVVEVDSY